MKNLIIALIALIGLSTAVNAAAYTKLESTDTGISLLSYGKVVSADMYFF
jgi:hypothetical protein